MARSKGGRPPKALGLRHSAKVEVLLLEQDKETLQAASELTGSSMAAILREGGLERARQILAAAKPRKRDRP